MSAICKKNRHRNRCSTRRNPCAPAAIWPAVTGPAWAATCSATATPTASTAATKDGAVSSKLNYLQLNEQQRLFTVPKKNLLFITSGWCRRWQRSECGVAVRLRNLRSARLFLQRRRNSDSGQSGSQPGAPNGHHHIWRRCQFRKLGFVQ